ncbi:MAG: M6 family metalloprotease domain-containing protein [Acidobacteria bacterium]|nr:M6 family metalloprotease domain-containing protein [Acidobacteriota bacterium]
MSVSFPPSIRKVCSLGLLLLLAASASRAAYLRDIPQHLVQPDGERLNCLASGDEYFNWLHDAAGFVIIQDHATGFYVYARDWGGEIVPTTYLPGHDDPTSMGLQPGIRPSAEWLRRQEMGREFGPGDQSLGRPAAPGSGTINNIVIFVRFSDEAEFTDNISIYGTQFNTNAGSMKNYFLQASYNTLTIDSTFYPPTAGTVVSYQDSNPRNYYKPYDASTNPTGYNGSTARRDREHILLKNAVNFVSASVPGGLDVDSDNDGYVDNVCFIIDGSPTAWATLLWPHRWSLYSQTASINGKRVWDYNFQLQSALGVSVLCHEMFHSVGAPDLYHYNGDGFQPTYKWDLMEYNTTPPQHMGAYMKYRYAGWIASIPEITSSGTYTINPVTSSTNNCYRIASPNSANEYFVVEYRKKAASGFESAIPASGLLVYRINTLADGYGNSSYPTYPDEVYAYRPGGTKTANGSPTTANFTSDVGRTAINDSTNPSCWLYNTTSLGGLDISNVTSAGATISFTVTIAGGGGCTPPSITTQPQSQSITTGSNATLNVAASGTGPLGYQWYQGSSGDAGTPVGSGSASYTTPALSSSTNYWVRVTNACGAADSGTATITVSSACVAPSVTTQPRSQSVTSGQAVTLAVAATGTAPLSYQWYQGSSGDTAVPVGTDSNAYTTPPLVAPANYWVRITNACGATNSDTALITITSGCVGAGIDLSPVSQTIASGQSTMLTVLANGSAPVHYQWYQGSSGDTSAAVGSDSDSFLTPALSSTTSYWVRVSNSCGTADSDAALITVTSASGPTITRIKSKNATRGSRVTVFGAGFSPIPNLDAVYFGSKKASVSKATATSLKTKIPRKCPKGSIGVYVMANGKRSNTVMFQVK